MFLSSHRPVVPGPADRGLACWVQVPGGAHLSLQQAEQCCPQSCPAPPETQPPLHGGRTTLVGTRRAPGLFGEASPAFPRRWRQPLPSGAMVPEHPLAGWLACFLVSQFGCRIGDRAQSNPVNLKHAVQILTGSVLSKKPYL